MVEYCHMAIDILRRACLSFRKIMVEIGDTDLFVNAATIASTSSYLYRKNFLKDRTIGLVPLAGYHQSEKFSQKSVEWLLLACLTLYAKLFTADELASFAYLKDSKLMAFHHHKHENPTLQILKEWYSNLQAIFFIDVQHAPLRNAIDPWFLGER